MTQQLATQEKRYLSAFASWEQNGFSRDPAWIRDLRRDALAAFEQLGFPVARRGNEEWKYTDVGPIARSEFQLPDHDAAAHLPSAEVEQYAFAGAQRSRLVFVNGRYAAEHSSTEALAPEVTLCRLSEAFTAHAELAGQHLAKYADYRNHAFTALNTAFVQDGAFLHVPDGTVVPGTIQLLFISTGGDHGVVSYPRVLVLMGEGAQATIIETYAGPLGGRYFTNAVAEMVLGPGSALDHYKLQRESADSFHISSNQVVQHRDSSYSSLMLDTGGALVRQNLNILFDQEGANSRLHGLYLLDGRQHVDYSTFIDHAAPRTNSDELYKGVLDGRSHVVFGGKMLVRHDAQQISSYQTSKTLLLSDGAAVDTKPQLEIYADDVKCGHGAAIGQLDRDALFYLQSRGLSDQGARELLTYGFVSEVASAVSNVPFRAYLEQQVHARLREIYAGEGSR